MVSVWAGWSGSFGVALRGGMVFVGGDEDTCWS